MPVVKAFATIAFSVIVVNTVVVVDMVVTTSAFVFTIVNYTVVATSFLLVIASGFRFLIAIMPARWVTVSITSSIRFDSAFITLPRAIVTFIIATVTIIGARVATKFDFATVVTTQVIAATVNFG